eukprot:scaffold16083_cov90-Isochrysis_galbana.AAC.3
MQCRWPHTAARPGGGQASFKEESRRSFSCRDTRAQQMSVQKDHGDAGGGNQPDPHPHRLSRNGGCLFLALGTLPLTFT